MANVCNRCKRASTLALVEDEMLCDDCNPMKAIIDYHKNMDRLRKVKDNKVTIARSNLAKQTSKTTSGKTLTINRPQVNSSAVDRAKQVAKSMKTVAKKK